MMIQVEVDVPAYATFKDTITATIKVTWSLHSPNIQFVETFILFTVNVIRPTMCWADLSRERRQSLYFPNTSLDTCSQFSRSPSDRY